MIKRMRAPLSIFFGVLHLGSCVTRLSTDVRDNPPANESNADELTEQEDSFVRDELPRLGTPGLDEATVLRWTKLIEIACRTNNAEISQRILNRKSFHLDASYSVQYDLHLFDFYAKNPKLFFQYAIPSFGGVREIAETFITEAGVVTLETLKNATDRVEVSKQDREHSVQLIKEATDIENTIFAKYGGDYP